MTRLLLALAGVVLLAITALAAVWLLGQLLTGLGLFIVGAAGVLGRLLWFLLITGLLSGVVYFVSSAWRPSVRAQALPPESARPGDRRATDTSRRGRAETRAETDGPATAPVVLAPTYRPATRVKVPESVTSGPVRSDG